MLLASSFERDLGGWKPVNLAESVTADRVSNGTAYSGSAFLRVSTADPGGSVARDLDVRRQIPGTGNFVWDSEIAVWAWVRTASGGPNMLATLAVWQLGVDTTDPATHPTTEFSVNNTWTLVSNAIELIAGSFDVRVELYLNTVGPALDIDCVFVN